MANSRYNFKVKIGNWNDELYLEEVRQNKNVLLIQNNEYICNSAKQYSNTIQ